MPRMDMQQFRYIPYFVDMLRFSGQNIGKVLIYDFHKIIGNLFLPGQYFLRKRIHFFYFVKSKPPKLPELIIRKAPFVLSNVSQY